jgi:tetratricopeptide (TPR) repeat protein
MIRVDSPSDVVILEPSNPVLQLMKWKTSPTVNRHRFTSAEQWKELGNQYFKDDLFVPAALAWSRGLELAPSMHSLRLNRSQAYIKLQWFSAALADAVHVLSTPESSTQTNKKASYRAASAEYGLGRYRNALVRLETLDEGTDIKSLKARCRDRFKEAEMGEYAWMDMFHAGQHAVPHLDIAEFVSPAVATATILTRGGGRGIRSMRDIKAGELLVSTQPYHDLSFN